MQQCLKNRHITIRMRWTWKQYKSRCAMTNMEGRQYMSKEDDVFNSVFTYIEDNLTEKLTVEEIAKHVYLSPTYLQSVFKEHFGIPLAEYVRSQKLKRAMDLLYNTERRISDIAYDSGFEHESSFIRSFKREFGMTPGEARRKKCHDSGKVS
ncbi:AraC family transcriptional regulator [Clostridium sp. OM07-10AC]|nr:AraC family transcriptional regulator [Clostridium sp. OM07-9AC]RHV03519.1 AraC family transcriptional regulator [Clostridium sp. OM07-10AC]